MTQQAAPARAGVPDRPAEPAPRIKAAPVPATLATILVVEHDDRTADELVGYLADDVAPAESVTRVRRLDEALLAARTAACVVLDMELPDTDGLAALRAVVEAAPDTAVISLAGRGDPGNVEALVVGAQDHLAKSDITPGVLSRSVRYAIERKRAQQVSLRLREAQLSSYEQARLERGLLPRPLLRTEAVECSTYYRPGRDGAVLGGDFFDVVETADGVVRAIIADVMGHGPDEAALGVHLRVAWRTLVLAGTPDSQLLPMLAQLFAAEDTAPGTFVTVCDVTLVPERETACLRVAGHPAPLLCAEGTAKYVEVAVGPPLGISIDRNNGRSHWPETSMSIPGGSSLILYTDGLLDSYSNPAVDDSMGLDEIVEVVTSLVSTGDAVRSWISSLVGNAPRPGADDAAVVVLTTKPHS
jgi:FixJ family two-component response regulator